MERTWNEMSVLERRQVINAAYAGSTVRLKVDEIEISSAGLRFRIGKNWFVQNITVSASVPSQTIDLNKAKKGLLTIPSQEVNARVSVSFS